MSNTGFFMYFAFGSNLLKERLQLANPSAVFYCVGRLKGYVLNFGLWGENVTSRWNGGVATIEECPDEDVWGVVWKMATKDITTLDEQEGVDKGVYSPMEVTIETESGPLLCRTYKMNNVKPCLPSPQYKQIRFREDLSRFPVHMQVVCLGAQQNGLPELYVKKLQALETNNYTGPSILDDIGERKAQTLSEECNYEKKTG